MSATAIRTGKDLEAVIIDLLEAAANKMTMSNAQLRPRVRDLVVSGDLPDERPVVENAGSGFGSFKRGSPCLIRGEPDAVVAYFWTGGRVAHFHAACDALWKLARG